MLRQIWVEIPSAAQSYNDDDVAIAVNAAFQEIWSAPNDYYRRKSTTLNTVASTEGYSLGATVQEVLNPVKIGASQLRGCRNRGEFDHYATRFLGATSDPAAEGQPVAYYVSRENNAGNDDLVAVEILFSPVPDDAYTVAYDYVAEAPNYATTDMDDAVEMEFPHKYCESILLPIAAKHLAGLCHWFHNDGWDQPGRDRDKVLAESYMRARAILGYVDPIPAESTDRKEVSR